MARTTKATGAGWRSNVLRALVSVNDNLRLNTSLWRPPGGFSEHTYGGKTYAHPKPEDDPKTLRDSAARMERASEDLAKLARVCIQRAELLERAR